MVRDGAHALLVNADAFFGTRAVQFATLAARHGIPAAYSTRAFTDVGGVMSFGASATDAVRQVGVYTGQILKGAKAADLPELQSTKLELVINLYTTRALGLAEPTAVQLLTDAVIV